MFIKTALNIQPVRVITQFNSEVFYDLTELSWWVFKTRGIKNGKSSIAPLRPLTLASFRTWGIRRSWSY